MFNGDLPVYSLRDFSKAEYFRVSTNLWDTQVWNGRIVRAMPPGANVLAYLLIKIPVICLVVVAVGVDVVSLPFLFIYNVFPSKHASPILIITTPVDNRSSCSAVYDDGR